MIPIQKSIYFVTKIDQVEQEIKEKLGRSASKLDRPTSEMLNTICKKIYINVMLRSLISI